jgi:hypothetical protein
MNSEHIPGLVADAEKQITIIFDQIRNKHFLKWFIPFLEKEPVSSRTVSEIDWCQRLKKDHELYC